MTSAFVPQFGAPIAPHVLDLPWRPPAADSSQHRGLHSTHGGVASTTSSLSGRGWRVCAGAAATSAVLAGQWWKSRRSSRGSRCSASSLVAVKFSAGEESQSTKKSGGSDAFGFDGSLFKRFLEIAEPYFVPTGPGRESNLGILVFGLLLGVASGTFVLFLAALGVSSNIPTLAALFPAPGAAGKLAELATTTNLCVAGAGFSAGAVIFWTRREDLEGRWRQWGFLALLVFLLLCVTGINVVISYVFRSIDNVLVAKKEAEFYTQMQLFIAVLVVAVPVLASYKFVRQTFANSWREYLTVLILDSYFRERAYYLLDSNSTDTSVDNPDQRIAEDVESFTSETLGFLLDILGSLSNLISFSAILWSTSEQLTFALIAYAFVGTFIALAVGSELIGINYKQLRLQADFRYSLVHVRDNAEAIAFYQGEAREKAGVTNKLRAAIENYSRVIQWTAGLNIYQKIFFYVARLVPYFVVGGLYFAGKVDFGTLGQVTFAFSMVLSSVTLIVSRIQDISRFSAGINRLGSFYEALLEGERDLLRASSHDEQLRITTETFSGGDVHGGQIQLDDLSLWTPTGRQLIQGVNVQLAAPTTPSLSMGSLELPSRLLVVGSSGVGKSSILRAVAGLWKQGSGRIVRPDITEMLFLPQKPYMPLGDLRTQLLYPKEVDAQSPSDGELVEVLGRFGLGDLPQRFAEGFDSTADWSRVLSLGEQQRVAAARCLLASPRLAVLDEATSALPVKDERNLYMCLQERGIGYISVGHRPSLIEYHDLILELLGEGKWRIMSPKDYKASTESSWSSDRALQPQ